MTKILGKGNQIVFKTKNGHFIENSDFYKNAQINIIGENNYVEFYLEEEKDIKDWVENPGLQISICGNRNKVILGDLSIGYNPGLGINGFNLIVGGKADPWIDPLKPRSTNDCIITVGNHTLINGMVMYLQDDHSSVTVGDDCMFSWGIDIWCSDVHTITDLNGKPLNFGHKIEIGNHVWVGKDVKIGKNTKICNDSIIGWNSLVTKKFAESNVIIAGVPAIIVKREVNWDGRCINNYIDYLNNSEKNNSY